MRATRWAVRLAALSIACSRGPTSGKTAAPPAGLSPPPRSVRVEQDAVAVEGQWIPIEPGPDSPLLPNAVRLRCLRAERSCKEELTRPAGQAASPVREAHEYRLDEWTKWGQAAGRLVASRREGGVQVEIRVSLNGLTAEKVVIDKGHEIRWRIE